MGRKLNCSHTSLFLVCPPQSFHIPYICIASAWLVVISGFLGDISVSCCSMLHEVLSSLLLVLFGYLVVVFLLFFVLLFLLQFSRQLN